MKSGFVLAGRIVLNLVVFCVSWGVTAITWTLAMYPILLIGISVAVFAKSRQVKYLGIAAIFGAAVWLPLLLGQRWLEH